MNLILIFNDQILDFIHKKHKIDERVPSY